MRTIETVTELHRGEAGHGNAITRRQKNSGKCRAIAHLIFRVACIQRPTVRDGGVCAVRPRWLPRAFRGLQPVAATGFSCAGRAGVRRPPAICPLDEVAALRFAVGSASRGVRLLLRFLPPPSLSPSLPLLPAAVVRFAGANFFAVLLCFSLAFIYGM